MLNIGHSITIVSSFHSKHFGLDVKQ